MESSNTTVGTYPSADVLSKNLPPKNLSVREVKGGYIISLSRNYNHEEVIETEIEGVTSTIKSFLDTK